jgi:hypothetical protein
LLACLVSVMAVVHCRIDSNFLTNAEVVDIGPDFSDGATELVSQGHWEFCTSIGIFRTFGRHEDRTRQVFVEISTTYTAVCHLKSDFVASTCPVLL